MLMTNKHLCPCGLTFYGRKNKIYHHTKCKQQFNNAKASEKRKALLPGEKELRNNFTILLKLYENFKDSPVPFKVLQAMEFKSELYTGIANIKGKCFYTIYSLAYEVNQQDKTIKIHKYE